MVALSEQEALAQEFASQYGTAGNAADLIASQRAAVPQSVQRASLMAVDEEATEALDLSSVEPQHGGEIKAAVVRGGHIVAVEELPDGRTTKIVQKGDDDAALGSDTVGEATAKATANENAKLAEVNSKFAEKFAALRAEHAEAQQAAYQEAAEESKETIKAAKEEAAAEAEAEAEPAPAPKRGGRARGGGRKASSEGESESSS
jgi:hypothetical protein